MHNVLLFHYARGALYTSSFKCNVWLVVVVPLVR